MRPSGPRRLFLDTGVLLAAALPKDPDHAAAVAILHRVADGEWTTVHTSDYVVAEALNFVRMKVKRRGTAEVVLGLVLGSETALPVVEPLIRIHGVRFARALELYRAEFERGLSFTDWTSIVAMREADVGEIATFDRGFRGIVRVVGG